jgi:hypothetical protein
MINPTQASLTFEYVVSKFAWIASKMYVYFANIVPHDVFKFLMLPIYIFCTWTSCWEETEILVGCFPISLDEYVLHIYKDQNFLFFPFML